MLTDLKIRNAKPKFKNYKLQDQLGLSIVITPTDRKHWRFRYQLANRRREAGLGCYPDVNLTTARQKVISMREKIQRGLDPLDERQLALKTASEKKQKTQDTFARAVDIFLRTKGGDWSETHLRDVTRIFEKELLPTLALRPVLDIKKTEVRLILDNIITRNALTWVRDVLAYYGGVIRNYNSYSESMAHDYSIALQSYLPKRPREIHHTALPAERLGEFLYKLRFSQATAQNRIAIELLVLTLVRTTELRGAVWTEIDFESRIWTIPANRMKAGLEHRVPLTSD